MPFIVLFAVLSYLTVLFCSFVVRTVVLFAVLLYYISVLLFVLHVFAF